MTCDHQRDHGGRIAMLPNAAPCRPFSVERADARGVIQTHNAGVAGSSPAPAIAGQRLSARPPNSATTRATKRTKTPVLSGGREVLVAGVRFTPRCLVYGLVDPREPERIRYVGKTTQAPLLRYVQHFQSKGPGTGWRRQAWLAELRSARRQPHMVLLEHVASPDNLGAREAFWIREFQTIGQADTNARAPKPENAEHNARVRVFNRTGVMPPRGAA